VEIPEMNQTDSHKTTQQDSSGVRIPPPAIYVVAIALGFLVEWAAPVRIAGNGRWIALRAGCVLLGIAVGLMAWTAKLMFRAGTTPNPTRPTTALVIKGPFRVTRNPMYLGWEIICVGLGLIANALWPIVMAVPAALVTRRLVIDKEEQYLERKFGAEYSDYKTRVRRWV
jgi:protein-S-isoprenylcysteine O-methyltransferase Ste14